MGLFGGFCSFVSSAARAVGSAVRGVVNKVKEVFSGGVEETSSRTSREDSYDREAATIAETKRINKILSDFSLKLCDEADELEVKVLKESGIYFDGLVDFFNKTSLKINTTKIKKNKIKIERKIKGSFKKYLSKRVSIDDLECLAILKLDSGNSKKKKMNEFGNKVLREAVEELRLNIEESLLEQQEYIEDCINEKIEENNSMKSEILKKCDELANAFDQGELAINEKKCNIIFKLEFCELCLANIME